jgi:hypothetical protein
MEAEFEIDALYMVAVMKMQLERGRLRKKVFHALVDKTLSELGIDHHAFEDYLRNHKQELEDTIECIGF